MSNSTQKREFLVALDAEFAEKLDQFTDKLDGGDRTSSPSLVRQANRT